MYDFWKPKLMDCVLKQQGSHAELYKHIVTINADRIIEQDNETPTGRILCVGATIMDLRVPHELGPAISRFFERNIH